MARQKAPTTTADPAVTAPAAIIVTEGGQTPSSNVTLVANHHTGPLMFPNRGDSGVSLPPLVLQPGRVTPVDKDEWERRKQNHVVGLWMDNGILSEVPQMLAQVAVTDQTSTNLDNAIPDNLKPETHSGDYGSAAVQIQGTGTANL